MKAAWIMVALLVAGPALGVQAANEQAPAFADVKVSVNIDLATFKEVGPPDPGNQELDATAASETPPHACGDVRTSPSSDESYLDHYTPAGISTLVFSEDETQIGCAEARYAIPPIHIEGAVTQPSTLHVSFDASRNVKRTAGQVETHVEQGLRVYLADTGEDAREIDDPTLEPLDCFGDQPIFTPGLALVGKAQQIDMRFDLSRCNEAVQNRTLVLAFYFKDGDMDRLPPAVPPPAGQTFTAQLADLRVAFEGASLPMGLRLESGSDPDDELVGYLEATIHAPDPVPGQHMELSFGISNEWGIHALYERNSTGLHRVGTTEFRSSEQNGTLQFTLPNALLQKRGGGEYVVVFSGPATGQIEAFRIPLVAVALVLPLLAGLLAQRNLNHLYRSARGRLRRFRWSLQLSLVGAWTLYVAVAVTLVVRSTGLGMAAWPLPPANLIAYILLAATVLVMAIVGVIARRRDMGLVLEDLTELERIQAELERSNRELEQFAYVASHDLKEPLRMVAGYTQLLEMRYGKKLDSQGKEFLLFAAEGSRRLQHMVDDLLAYSRVRSDQASFKQVDLNAVMSIVEGHLRGLIQERNVELRYDRLHTIHADQGQLVQLLLNLIQNAIKFSPQDNPVVEVTTQQQGDRYSIAVRDEGIGIEPVQQERIFQIFQRLHLREEYEGNGIGLAMCKKIAEQMGGKISVTSEAGQGSTFTVLLPDLRPRLPRGGKAAPATARVKRADSPA